MLFLTTSKPSSTRESVENPRDDEKFRSKKKMTQKSNQFKGQQKKKTVAPNRHGKAIQNRKGIHLNRSGFLFLRFSSSSCVVLTGRRYMKPSKTTKELDTDRVSSICSFLHLR